MANNTITETLRFKFNTIARDQSDVTFIDWRDLDLGTRADSNMQKLDTELYKILKRGLFIANTTTPSANQYVVSNSAITEMFDKMALLLIPNSDNTGTTTLQINSFVSSPIKKVSNNTYIDIVAGDLKSKQPTLIYYDLNSNVFVLASALVQSASTTQSGIVQLSNDTNSTDETKAVTPKALKSVSDAKLDSNQKGQPNGVASLDTEGKVSITQIPSSILGSLKYIDTWDASGGTTPSNPKNGNYWVISVAGVINAIEYNIKDWLIYNNSTWSKLDGEDTEFATQIEAEEGTNNIKVMSPLRVFQSIAKWISDTTVNTLTTTAKTIVGSINELSNKIGILSNLNTTEKGNLVGAITEVNASLSVHTNALITDTNGIHGLKIEQGAWTPVLKGQSAEGSFIYTKQSGKYYKIDKMIYAYFEVELSAITSVGSGTIMVTGLPYQIISDDALRGGNTLNIVSNIDLDGGYTQFGLHSQPNLNYAYLTEFGNSVENSYLTTNKLKNNSRLCGCITYITN